MQPIYNRRQQTIGYFNDIHGGAEVAITDRNQRTLAFYDKQRNKTYDRQRRFIGEGNQLMRFVMAEFLS